MSIRAVGINKNGYKPNMIDVEYGNDCFFRGRQLLHNFNKYAEGIQLRIIRGEKNINFGSVYENAVAQELVAHGIDP